MEGSPDQFSLPSSPVPPPPLSPRPGATESFLPTVAEQGGLCRAEGKKQKIKGLLRGALNPEPSMRLQTDVPNKSPAAPRVKTAGGLAEAKVRVN